MGKRPVRTRDTPGFVVNHVGRGYGPEALRILAEGIAAPPVIDRIMRAAGFRMGPFELFDLVGLDISKAVMEQVYRDYYEEPAYRPSAIASARVAAGLLGRKTGEGFYRYGDGAAPEPEPANAPLRTPIRVHPSVPEAEAIRSALRQAGAELEDGAKASDAATCLIAPLGADAAGSAVAIGLDPRRVVAVDLLFGAARPLAAMRTLMTEPGRAEWVAELLGKAEPLPVINDSPGFVAQRIVAMIVNVASNVAQQRIAAPADIDLAVKLGLGYPHGPLEWADAIGPSRVLQVLDGLYDFYRDPAYRAAPWLRRRALLGVSMLTPD
jgi:3-hydroxybutyryl-CoA dehydrogenase